MLGATFVAFVVAAGVGTVAQAPGPINHLPGSGEGGKPTGSLINASYVPETEAQVTKRLGFDPSIHSIMPNPYEYVPNWPHLPEGKAGGAIGMVPDGTGGVWMAHRNDPAVVHINAAGDVVGSFPGSSGNGGDSKDALYSYVHGLCKDTDGNFWVLDSGTFQNSPDTLKKGNQVRKFSPDGKLLLTLGKPGIGIADGVNTFLQPSACIATPEGDILIGDGHWSRPNPGQQDGDRLVWVTKDGKFIKQFGKLGTGPGEFLGPHGMAFDSQGRLFVADRANNRVQIFDKNMNFLDDWKQFGRPSMVIILKDDTLIVSDSESIYYGFRPANWELGPTLPGTRNAGWKAGIWIASAKDGTSKYFIPNTKPEGLTADDQGNIFGGLTGNCERAISHQCLQKYTKKK
jgi:sugar lactone lactonase YvrE